MLIQTILHPTDFSETSRCAFNLACSLAKDYSARLILFHVVPPLVGPLLGRRRPNPLEPAEFQELLTGKYCWPQPSDPKVVVEHRVSEGEPAEEILRLAYHTNCDVIVMGTQGRTGLNRLLIGSVAEEVLRQAVCPVLVLRNPSATNEVETKTQPLEREEKAVQQNEKDKEAAVPQQ
jgi:nucleotide-binding universal stress UspA family protein